MATVRLSPDVKEMKTYRAYNLSRLSVSPSTLLLDNHWMNTYKIWYKRYGNRDYYKFVLL
jgi:hypothetical protein